MPRISRRSFLAGSAAAGLGLASPLPVFADERPMPLRVFGRTGLSVSLAGLGTAQLGNRSVSDQQAVTLVRRAVALGINYIDTAPSYGATRSERRIGLALDGLRDKVILATKTLRRDRKGAQRDLHESLARLKTDRIDLWQFHALRTTADTDRILGKGGALEAAVAARKAGQVRLLGVTGHFDPAVFVDALRRHDFDALLIPLSCIDPHHKSFEASALPVAKKRKTAVVAMKAFCSGGLPRQAKIRAEDCLRYTYGLPVATCIVGCSRVAEVELAAHVARNLKPLDDAERAALWKKTKPFSPKLEWYKR